MFDKDRSWTWIGNFSGDDARWVQCEEEYGVELRKGLAQPGPAFAGNISIRLVGEVPPAGLQDQMQGIYIRLADWVAWFLRQNPGRTERDAVNVVFQSLRWTHVPSP
jgi:hypothetical protein